MSRASSLQGLIDKGQIWPATRRHASDSDHRLCPTGHTELDALLGGGLPRQGLIEFLADGPGLGESRLLRSLWQARSTSQQWHVSVCPPCLPYAPHLQANGIDPGRWLVVQARNDAEALWSIEQSLRSGGCASIMAWPSKVNMTALRRLQLLADEYRVPVVLVRPEQQRTQASPALLRLWLQRQQERTLVEVLKCRGGKPHARVSLDLFSHPGLASVAGNMPRIKPGARVRSHMPWPVVAAGRDTSSILRH